MILGSEVVLLNPASAPDGPFAGLLVGPRREPGENKMKNQMIAAVAATILDGMSAQAAPEPMAGMHARLTLQT